SKKGMKRKLIWNLLSDALRKRYGILGQGYNSEVSINNNYTNDYSSGIKRVGHIANVFGIYINSMIGSEKRAIESTVNSALPVVLSVTYQVGPGPQPIFHISL